MSSVSPADGGASTPRVRLDYYTDPLCVWSWAFEAPLRRLRYEFGTQLVWRSVMGGMIANWESFADPLHAIHRPAQMAPYWFYVRQQSGMPLDERIWLEDPPDSSFPACLAVKAAERQGADMGERYLRRLREAVMLQRRNIARCEELLALASALSCDPGGSLDIERFAADLDSEAVLQAFREDLMEARYRGIGRFPTLILRGDGPAGVLLTGWRPYAVLRAALAHLAPGIQPTRTAGSAEEYARYCGSVAAHEVAEALEIPEEAARREMTTAQSEGRLPPGTLLG